MSPRILYFDLGNVLLWFSHEQQCRQMAEVAGVPAEEVRRALYGTSLGVDSECGRAAIEAWYERLCRQLGTRPDFEKFLQASNDIFALNTSILPVVGQLRGAGFRLGLLSNTSEGHWKYVSDGRFAALLPDGFDPLILSYEVGAMKPDAAIFRAAAERAGVEPGEVFYVDDIAGHVEAARRFGFDAVQYVGTPALVTELRRRGLRFNY